ncbi:MAG: hypothetical protein ABSF69_22295 [Polyangiaceae bacterium]|jgi:methyl-accepting chemotaxis protein
MKISTKLTVFYIAVIAVFVLLAASLMSQTVAMADGYEHLLAAPLHDMDAARVVQVDFKKQVQEWKDILLRGHAPDDLARYTKQFHEREAIVSASAKALAEHVDDSAVKATLDEFVAAHRALSAKYKEAYDVYLNGGFDFKAADKVVRGQDRQPTDLFDRAVMQLDDRVRVSVESQTVAIAAGRTRALGLAGGLLLLLGIGGLVIVRGILGRLGKLKAIADRLAVADIAGLVIDISGRDEIGAFGSSMKGVHAALEELLSVANSPTKVS